MLVKVPSALRRFNNELVFGILLACMLAFFVPNKATSEATDTLVEEGYISYYYEPRSQFKYHTPPTRIYYLTMKGKLLYEYLARQLEYEQPVRDLSSRSTVESKTKQ